MKACSACGVANDDDATFCAACYSFLGWPDDETKPAAPPAAPPASAPEILVTAPQPGLREEPVDPAPRTPVSHPDQDDSVSRALRGLTDSRRLAERRNRTDLVGQLDEAKKRLGHRTMRVALVGEFKKGKSTLVNALLQTAVCPVDADVVTMVPMLVHYGEKASVTAHFEKTGAGDQPLSTAIAVDSIEEFATEVGNPGNVRHVRSLEVGVPHRLLKSGLSLIDTPGVGGLDSAHGIVTLGVLDEVDGILFVTDASAELNQPELTFLKSALERCPQAACVMTKTDLYPQWRHIAELNVQHLTDAGLGLPVIPVSSFLRLRSRKRPELLSESGFSTLIEFLANSVAGRANDTAAAAATQEVEFIAKQLAHEVQVERAVLVEPAKAGQVVQELTSARNRAAGLASPTASWVQELNDGVQDLVRDVQYDLNGRMTTLKKDAEELVDESDPKDSWDDIEEWLRRQAVSAAVANYDMLKARANELADQVAEFFDTEAGNAISIEDLVPPAGLQNLSLGSVETLRATTGRFGSMLMTGRTAVLVPLTLFSLSANLFGFMIAGPAALVLTGVLGTKLFGDERKRQLKDRRQQAKAAVYLFVSEVARITDKETGDALNRTRRQLRDEFQLRATAIHRSSVNALDAAARAAQLSGSDRRDRVAELSAQTSTLREVSNALHREPEPAGG